MDKRHLHLEGPKARGTVISASVLRDLLRTVIEGSQRAVRLRTQGKSAVSGPLPEWIAAATEFDVEVKEGSTLLELSAPTLLEADRDRFAQGDFFPEMDPSRTSFDYLTDTLEAALGREVREEASDLFDRSFLRRLRNELKSVFERGIESITISGIPHRKESLRIQEDAVSRLQDLEKRIPPPQSVRLVGKLDSIRHSDRAFTLAPTRGQEKVKGTVRKELITQLQELWGQTVLAQGTCHFTARGTVQLIEAELLRPASRDDASIWGEVPDPLDAGELRPAAMREPQGPRSGLNALIGAWPGEEADDEVAAALEELS